MSEAASHELIHRRFLESLKLQGRWAALLIGISIVVGTLGFHTLARQDWVDALLNALKSRPRHSDTSAHAAAHRG